MPYLIEEAESFSDRVGPLAEVLREHWEELATDKGLMALAPDVDRYRELERQGALFALYLHSQGECIGYSVNIMARNLHYRALTYSQNDVLFVRKANRAGRAGVLLMQATEHVAKKRGAQMHLWHAKAGTALDRLLPRMGYRVQDVIHSKVL